MTYLYITLTDTFAGEPNYSWVRRVTMPVPTNRRSLVRAAKAAVGLTGVRGRTTSYGDSFEFRPYRQCLILMANIDD